MNLTEAHPDVGWQDDDRAGSNGRPGAAHVPAAMLQQKRLGRGIGGVQWLGGRGLAGLGGALLSRGSWPPWAGGGGGLVVGKSRDRGSQARQSRTTMQRSRRRPAARKPAPARARQTPAKARKNQHAMPAAAAPPAPVHPNRLGGGPVFVFPKEFRGAVEQHLPPTAAPHYDVSRDVLFGGGGGAKAGGASAAFLPDRLRGMHATGPPHYDVRTDVLFGGGAAELKATLQAPAANTNTNAKPATIAKPIAAAPKAAGAPATTMTTAMVGGGPVPVTADSLTSRLLQPWQQHQQQQQYQQQQQQQQRQRAAGLRRREAGALTALRNAKKAGCDADDGDDDGDVVVDTGMDYDDMTDDMIGGAGTPKKSKSRSKSQRTKAKSRSRSKSRARSSHSRRSHSRSRSGSRSRGNGQLVHGPWARARSRSSSRDIDSFLRSLHAVPLSHHGHMHGRSRSRSRSGSRKHGGGRARSLELTQNALVRGLQALPLAPRHAGFAARIPLIAPQRTRGVPRSAGAIYRQALSGGAADMPDFGEPFVGGAMPPPPAPRHRHAAKSTVHKATKRHTRATHAPKRAATHAPRRAAHAPKRATHATAPKRATHAAAHSAAPRRAAHSAAPHHGRATHHRGGAAAATYRVPSSSIQKNW